MLDPCPDDITDSCNFNGSAAGVIGSNGGILITPDTKVELNIPTGAVSTDLSFSITNTGGGSQVSVFEGMMNVLQGYIIQPHGTQFVPPATIIFRWDDIDNDGVVDGTSLHEANLLLIKDGLVITPSCAVNPGCNMNTNELVVQVSSLSQFELAVPSTCLRR